MVVPLSTPESWLQLSSRATELDSHLCGLNRLVLRAVILILNPQSLHDVSRVLVVALEQYLTGAASPGAWMKCLPRPHPDLLNQKAGSGAQQMGFNKPEVCGLLKLENHCDGWPDVVDRI